MGTTSATISTAATARASEVSALSFASAARSLGRAARLRGLVVPDFASPPRRPDLDRSIRRRARAPLVSVRLRGRPVGAVLADMIEGVVVANRLSGPRADLVRSALWLAVQGEPGGGELGAEAEPARAATVRRVKSSPAAA